MSTTIVFAVAIALALLIPLGVNSLRRPQVGLLILAALLPYDGLLLLIDTPALVNGWKEGAVLAIFVTSLFTSRRIDRPVVPGFWWPTAALVALGSASFLAGPGIGSLTGLKVTYFYLLLPVALWLAPLAAAERDRLVTILMVNGVVTSVIGLAQQVLGAERLNALGYEYNSQIRFAGGLLRSFSTFVQPFPFAFFVMIVLLVGTPIALSDRGRLRNRLFLACSPLLVAGMLSAVVRGAVLGLAVGGLYLLVTRYRVLSHGLLVALVGVALLPGPVVAALGSSSSLQQRTTGWVVEVFDEGIEPLGTGIGSVGAAAELVEFSDDPSDATFPSPVGRPVYQPDNYYVKILIELGPLGLWFLLWSVGAAIAFAHRLSRPSAPVSAADRSLAEGITGASLAAAAAALVSTYWEIFPVDAYYWLLLGVLPSLLRSSTTPMRSPQAAAGSRPMPGSWSTPSPA